ncbi:hypothetical protein OUZ56_015387 [Daphnia magna]|uniref:Uncharacterized protein n=1 Tax=Daphnia magna TaxID=35525 RepID=A0ABR0AMQ0_9CRUS|nr:hypothetical protein OUZ56_015387 [Daphnia magna]
MLNHGSLGNAYFSKFQEVIQSSRSSCLYIQEASSQVPSLCDPVTDNTLLSTVNYLSSHSVGITPVLDHPIKSIDDGEFAKFFVRLSFDLQNVGFGESCTQPFQPKLGRHWQL